MWPDTALEAAFISDVNLQDVAVDDDSACPKEFIDCIPSCSRGRLNCEQSSHGYMRYIWFWEEVTELRIAFKQLLFLFDDEGKLL